MACGATLKRAHEFDFDPLMSPSRSPKRMCVSKELMSPSSSVRKTCSPPANSVHSPAFAEAAQKLGLYSPQSAVSQSVGAGGGGAGLWHSCLDHSSSSSMTAGTGMSMDARWSPSQSTVTASSSRCSVTPSHSDTALLSRSGEQLFSLSQVDSIVRRIVSEHDEQVRDKFNAVLHTKLAEQHEAFVKFTSDQLSRKFSSQPTDCSYVS
jgi:hypothetical protein